MLDTLLGFILGFGVIIYSIILHEIAHGFVAEKLGDPTARRAGRITLNPLPHIDPVMTIIIPAATYFFSQIVGAGFIFGGAKPVPINPLYFNDPKKDIILVSLAGVTTNFLLAIIFAAGYHTLGSVVPILALPLSLAASVNVLLGVFNLIPIPPLDGSKVLAGFLSRANAAALLALEPYGFVIIIMLLEFTPFGRYLAIIINLLLNLLGIAVLNP